MRSMPHGGGGHGGVPDFRGALCFLCGFLLRFRWLWQPFTSVLLLWPHPSRVSSSYARSTRFRAAISSRRLSTVSGPPARRGYPPRRCSLRRQARRACSTAFLVFAVIPPLWRPVRSAVADRRRFFDESRLARFVNLLDWRVPWRAPAAGAHPVQRLNFPPHVRLPLFHLTTNHLRRRPTRSSGGMELGVLANTSASSSG